MVLVCFLNVAVCPHTIHTNHVHMHTQSIIHTPTLTHTTCNPAHVQLQLHTHTHLYDDLHEPVEGFSVTKVHNGTVAIARPHIATPIKDKVVVINGFLVVVALVGGSPLGDVGQHGVNIG